MPRLDARGVCGLRGLCVVTVVLGLAWVAGPAGAHVTRSGIRPTPASARDAGPAILFMVQPAVVERGRVRVRVTASPGSVVQLFEQVGAVRVLLATLPMRAATAGRRQLMAWRCDRLDRDLVGVLTAPDGGVQEVAARITTPSCANRLTAAVVGRARAGGVARVVVRDRFGVGDVRARACLGVGRIRTCRDVRMSPGVRSATVTLRTAVSGRGRLLLTTTGQRLVVWVPVPRRAGALRILAAGDSEIQVLDGFLRQRLKRFGASVISDDHISTSISNPRFFNWPQRARTTASTIRPDVTVMFLGANDGFPLRSPGGVQVRCCRPAWSTQLARRTRGMMRSYSRGGQGRVYWMLLPPPRKASFARVFRAVNRGYLEAAKSFPDTVQIVDLRRVFPNPNRGRQADGIHLSTGSARIAAGVIERAMRADGVL